MPADANRVKELFLLAVGRPPADRPAFLAGACGGDADLRAAVERLLAAHAAPDSRIDRAGGEPGGPAATAATSPEPPTGTHLPDAPGDTTGPHRPPPGGPPDAAGVVIGGRYKLVEPIGEGGMGTVWMAQQTEPVKRLVAVKLIRDGMDSRAVLARFEAERQALALMDHPNIARVYDAGAAADGRPYFVMELVKGVPITRYCDQHRLTPRERLELFVPVCQAVQHAHQKGVIHRDIKPGNVLVARYDDRPVPKVIDFGVAKATEQKLTDVTLHTGFGAIVGTPEYMSPEQASFNALDVDTRSDVYALGVLLYELLTGSTPVDRKSLGQAVLLEVLRIVREVEAPRPSQKLSTADALPSIAANRHTEPKRLAALVRGELDWIVMKALEKDRGRRYETATGFAADIQRYLAGEPVVAAPPSRTYRLRKLARRNRATVTAAGLVLLALVAGIVGTSLGLIEARKQRDAAADAAEAERAAKLAEADQRRAAERAAAQVQQGIDLLAGVFTDLDPTTEQKEGRPLRAILGDRLADAAERLEGEAVGDPLEVAHLQHQLGLSLLRFGGYAERAAVVLARARATLAARLGPDDSDTLKCAANLAAAYREAGRPAQALPLHQDLHRRHATQRGEDDPTTITILSNLAMDYRAVGRHGEAARLLEDCLRLRTGRLGPDDPETLSSMVNLALAYREVGRPADAVRLHEEAGRRLAAVVAPDHPYARANLNNLGFAYRATGRRGDAVRVFEDCVRLTAAAVGPDHPDTLTALDNLATEYRVAGRGPETVPVLVRLIDGRRKRGRADTPGFAGQLVQLAAQLLTAGEFAAAEPHLRECLSIREKTEPDAWATFNTRSMLGGSLLGQGKHAEAEPLLVAGYEGLKAHEPAIPPAARAARLSEAADRLVELYAKTGKPDELARWRAVRAEYPFVAPLPRPTK